MKIKTGITIIGEGRHSREFKADDALAGRVGNQINLGVLFVFARTYLEKSGVIKNHKLATIDMSIEAETEDGRRGWVMLPMALDDPRASGIMDLVEISKPVHVDKPAEADKPAVKELGMVACDKCGGTGRIKKLHVEKQCYRCKGRGKTFDADQMQIDKDALLHPDKRKRIEEMSEAAGYRAFRSKRGV